MIKGHKCPKRYRDVVHNTGVNACVTDEQVL